MYCGREVINGSFASFSLCGSEALLRTNVDVCAHHQPRVAEFLQLQGNLRLRKTLRHDEVILLQKDSDHGNPCDLRTDLVKRLEQWRSISSSFASRSSLTEQEKF